jgi:hypothetical protein
MTARHVVLYAGTVGGLGWLVKVALIWENGGTNTDEGLVAVMFLVGALGLLVASAAAGAWLTARRPAWLRALAAVGGVVAFLAVFSLLDLVLSPLAEDGSWAKDEVEIVASALLGLALAVVAGRGRQTAVLV